MRTPCFIAGLVALTASALLAAAPLEHFITARDGKLLDGDQVLRFISWDIPNLLMVEDNVPFTEQNPWRLPDRFELTDALATVRQMGGTVARSYVLTVRRTNDAADVRRHVLGPGKFSEESFRSLDLALQIANEQGIRLIIPLVDNWVWQGGRAEYAAWRGKTKDEFWTDPQLIADFEETIRFVLTRTNTLTGIRYSDDKAVLCWETGNEISSPPSWTREIARYIKSLDHNHLVMDGFNASRLRQESFDIPEVDIVTTHHYPGGRAQVDFAPLIRENAARAKGRKPYVVGEFGFLATDKMEEAMKAINESGASGGLLWSLRFRDRDGGFYWHSEPDGANLYKAFHWPGSPIGAAYDEIHLMSLVRQYAFRIRGMAEPPVPVPAAPTLFPVTDPSAITWNGSVGANYYVVERAKNPRDAWETAGSDIDESFMQYRPLFADESVTEGDWYYRVRAKNDAGGSEPSNVSGPVHVTNDTLVDELADFSKVHEHQGGWQISNRDCRKAKEDAHRAAGNAGDSLVYKLSTAIQGFRLFTFFPQAIVDVKFSVSADGATFQPVDARRQDYFGGAGDYGYWKPVMFSADQITPGSFYLKIELAGETQIGRLEIRRSPAGN